MMKGIKALFNGISVTYLHFYSAAPDGADRLTHEVHIHLGGVLLQLSQYL